jgi:hypothetical protein
MFRIDEKGHVADLEETASDVPGLGHDISAFLQSGRFRVPADWATSTDAQRPFTVEFQFTLTKRGDKCPGERAARSTNVDAVIAICRQEPGLP